ncbi:MAG: WD40 repeat domain-containing protein [Deltaproteobacteria bacterium]
MLLAAMLLSCGGSPRRHAAARTVVTQRIATALGHPVLVVQDQDALMVTATAWSPDGGTLAARFEDGAVRLWNTRTGAIDVTLPLPAPGAVTILWSPDGRSLATQGEWGRIHLWDALAGTLRADVSTVRSGEVRGVTAIGWSPDGATLAVGSSEEVWLWNGRTGDLRATLQMGAVTLEWSPDGGTLAVGNEAATELWDARTGRVRARLHSSAGNQSITSNTMAWSPRGDTLAAIVGNDGVALCDGVMGQCRSPTGLTGTRRDSNLAWSPDGTSLATGDDDGIVCIWDVGTGTVRTTFHGRYGATPRAWWSPDGALLAVASGGTVQVWDPVAGTSQASLEGDAIPFEMIVWSADGGSLAARSGDTLRLWNPRTGTLLTTITVPLHGEFGWRHGSGFLAAPGAGVQLFRVADGASLWLRILASDAHDAHDAHNTVLAHDARGFYDGDERAVASIRFRVGPDLLTADLLTADQLGSGFAHPHLVTDFLAGRAIAPAPWVLRGVGRPPSVTFAGVPAGTTTPEIPVRVRATDRGGGISVVRVFVNGRPIDAVAEPQPPAGASHEGVVEGTVTVPLTPGDNEIVAEAYDESGHVRGERASTRVVRQAQGSTAPAR